MDDEYDNSSFCTLTIPEQLCLMCLYNKGILKLSLDRKQYTRALYLAVLCEMMIQNDMLLSTTTTSSNSVETSTAAVENSVQMDSYFDYDNPSFENHNNNHNNRYKSSSSSSRTSTGNSNSSGARRSNSHNNNNNNNNNNNRNNNKSGVGVVLEEENDFYFRFDSHVELLDQFTTHSSSSSSAQQHQQSYNNDDDDDDDHHHDNLDSDNNDYHDYHDDNNDEYELNDKNTKKNKSLRQQQQQINHHTRSKNKREEAGRRQKDNNDNKDDKDDKDDEGEMNPCLMFSGESEMTFFIRRFMTVASEQQSLHNYRLLSFVRNILWSNSNTMQNSMEQQVIYNIDSHIGIMLSKNNRTVEFKSSWLFGTCRFPIVNTRVKQQIKHYVLQMIECYGTKREKVIDRRGFALLACLNLIDTILIKEIIQKKQEIVSELSCDASTTTTSSPSFLMNNGRNNSSSGGSGSSGSSGGGLLNSVSSMFGGGGGSGSAITADERAKQEQLRKKARTIVLNGKVDHPDDIYYHFFQYLI